MIIIDTRSSMEFSMGHVDGAVNIPPDQFMTGSLPPELNGVDKDERIIVYCLSGSRSNVVAHILGQFGFTNVTNGINKDHVSRMISA